jgi:hypothetical protein
MRRSSSARLAAVFATLVLSAAGCSSGVEPAIDPAIAAGTYVLESVSGRGPAAGSFVLGDGAQAERRVSYTGLGDSVATLENVSVGTFELQPNGVIEFALQDLSRRSEFVWHVIGQLSGESFEISYPDPADGADIVESYRRQ